MMDRHHDGAVVPALMLMLVKSATTLLQPFPKCCAVEYIDADYHIVG
jgi:hypothetical protein